MEQDKIKLKAEKVVQAGSFPLAHFTEAIDTNQKLDTLIQAVKDIPKTEIPEMPEMPTTIEAVFKGASLVTIKGDKGDKGEKGDKGDIGPAGKNGENGKNGIDGKDGENGIDGKDGTNGINGVDGIDGKDGSPDTPDQVVEKVNSSKVLIKKERVEGLLQAIQNSIAQAIPVTTNFFNGLRAKNLVISGSGVSSTSQQGDTVTVVVSGGSSITSIDQIGPSQTGNSGKFLTTDGTNASWGSPAGAGDMVLASAQTNSGAKTFLDATMLLRNVANTFSSYFTNTNTAARTYTLPDKAGTVAMTSDITGTNSGTNTGDQTISITGDVTASGSTGILTATVTKINGTSMAGLATGILKNTTTTGVPSIATAGTDYVAPGAVTTDGITMSTGKMLGRATAGTGAIEEIAVTGSGSAVLATSPTLVTPTLGVASATTVNKVAITAPASGSTLTIPDGVTLTGPASSGTAMTLGNNETVTGVKTMSSIILPDQGQIKLTVPTTDLKATGPTCGDFNCGYTSSAIGDLVYLDSTGVWQKADNATSATTRNGMLAIALEVKATANALLVALPGSFIYSTTGFPTWTVGGPIYMSTAGAMTQTEPTTSGVGIRKVGFAVHADKMYFNPDNVYITHV